ncbi:MAG: hypothetical protein ABR528_09865 [Pseudonocardiaceae bacterium]
MRRQPPRRSRCPRGRAGRHTSRPSTIPRVLHRSATRALAYGRRRAATRLAGGSFQPHPGWRNFIAIEWRVLTDQTEALRVVEGLVEAQDWRADKRSSWLRILRRLVHSMDWSTGLITAVTAQRLGEAGDRAPRTVSRVLAWARDEGLIVVVEHGASAEFLGAEHGRTPTYALVTKTAAHSPTISGSPTVSMTPLEANPQLSFAVEKNGDLPTSCDHIKPLNSRRLAPAHQPATSWLVFRIPESAIERNLASQCLLQRLGLDRGGVSGVPLWRARALLRPWWDAGASPAGLLYAIDHHPDHRQHHRGDALRGAHDPLRVLGHRLRPWRDRLTELPTAVTGIRGNYLRKPTAAATTHLRTEGLAQAADNSTARAEVRQAARAALDAHLQLLRERRAARGITPTASPSILPISSPPRVV